jgi:L-lysine 2,3-aminomutase
MEDRAATPGSQTDRFRAFTAHDLPWLAENGRIPADQLLPMRAVASVLPFRTNAYVIDQLIDWSAALTDPIFRLTFPQADMLDPEDLHAVMELLEHGAQPEQLQHVVSGIRIRLNPHPDGQLDLNTPIHRGRRLVGVQHKYPETMLLFPRQGQTCHAYCSYCFRWAQFVGEPDLRMATNDVDAVTGYLRDHPEVRNVLITGGDALVMGAATLRRHVEALLTVESVEAIRLGTKSLSFWPYRFLTDRDADDLLRLIELVAAGGRHLALMAHFSHPRELQTDAVRAAIQRIRSAGGVIRCQAPLIRGINDSAEIWGGMWNEMVRFGAIPYYMFVERDTGPRDYFSVPLARGHEIFRDAYAQVSGLARTVRGPIMSATPGKVCVDGVTEIAGEKVFALRLVQARSPQFVGRPFFAHFDPAATWLSDLKPALGASEFLPGLGHV